MAPQALFLRLEFLRDGDPACAVSISICVLSGTLAELFKHK